MPNAARSIPTSSRPASRATPTSRSTTSRRTATTTARERRPDPVCTVPSDCQSTIASSIGIGMWSGAWTLTAAASALGSSTGGRSSVRTTMRWLAMPRRTRRGSSCSAKKDLSVSASAAPSTTSPSRTRPGWSSATAPRLSVTEPLTLTSAAAMCPGSSSRPTTTGVLEARLENTVCESARRRRALRVRRPSESARARCSGPAPRSRTTAPGRPRADRT